jgi:hypothetical protein
MSLKEIDPFFVLVHGFVRRVGVVPGCWLRRSHTRKEPLALVHFGSSKRIDLFLERHLMIRRVLLTAFATMGVLLVVAVPATPDPALSSVIDNLRNWVIGLLAALATLFLTIGGVRYMLAGGDPGQVERAKSALRSAAIGYAFAAMAPMLIGILRSVVGG